MQKLIETTAITHQLCVKNAEGGYDKYSLTMIQAQILTEQLAQKPMYLSLPEKITKGNKGLYPAHGAIIQPIPQKEKVWTPYEKKNRYKPSEEKLEQAKEWCESNLSWFVRANNKTQEIMIESRARTI